MAKGSAAWLPSPDPPPRNTAEKKPRRSGAKFVIRIMLGLAIADKPADTTSPSAAGSCAITQPNRASRPTASAAHIRRPARRFLQPQALLTTSPKRGTKRRRKASSERIDAQG